jgi:hypothetical protein
MGRWEHRYLGWDRFPDPSTPIEIEQLFTLESECIVTSSRLAAHLLRQRLLEIANR